MKVKKKVISFFVFSVAAILALAVGIEYFESKESRGLVERQKAGKSENVSSLLSMNSNSLYTFTSDYCTRAEVTGQLKKKAAVLDGQRISLPLKNYGVYASVVYGKDFEVFTTALNYSEKVGITSPEKVMFSKELVTADISKNGISHSFSILDGKLVELCVAPIYKKIVPLRAIPENPVADGYFLSMKVWDDSAISELSKTSGAKVFLEMADKPAVNKIANETGDTFTVRKDFKDIEGKTIAWVGFDYGMGGLLNSAKRTALAIGLLAVLALFIMMLLARFLFSWTLEPLRKLNASFKEKSLGDIEELKERKDEFGDISRLLENVFAFNKELESKSAMIEKRVQSAGATEEAKREFLLKVAGELKTPLASIKEALKILTENLADELDDEQSGFLEIARKNAEKAEGLVNLSSGPSEPN